MIYTRFTLALKSTIDYHTKLLADQLSLAFVDLNSASDYSDLLESDETILGWEFSVCEESPKDPLWYTEFEVGVMSMKDPSQYTSLSILGHIMTLYKPEETLPIFDYSGAVLNPERVGSLIVISSEVTPQAPDRATVVRSVSVVARAVRNPP